MTTPGNATKCKSQTNFEGFYFFMVLPIHRSFGKLVRSEVCLKKKHLIFRWYSRLPPKLQYECENILCFSNRKISSMTEALRMGNEFLYRNLN